MNWNWNLEDSSFEQKKISRCAKVRLLEIFNFESSLTFLLLLFFLWENLQKCLFDLIFSQISLFQIWLNFLVWSLSGTFRILFWLKNSKKSPKIFLSALLYEMFPLCAMESKNYNVKNLSNWWVSLLKFPILSLDSIETWLNLSIRWYLTIYIYIKIYPKWFQLSTQLKKVIT
jgi:hypothetical protein